MSDASVRAESVPEFVATAEEYRRALLSIRNNLTDKMHAMLRLQFHAPEQTASVADLARAAGFDTHHPATRQYGELGRHLAKALNVTAPQKPKGTPRYWAILSTGDLASDRSEDFRLVMRAELVAALNDLPWYGQVAARGPALSPA